MPIDLSWLSQSVPLWAFLVAFATDPYTWHERLMARLDGLITRVLPPRSEP
jgi:hypothetical protein